MDCNDFIGAASNLIKGAFPACNPESFHCKINIIKLFLLAAELSDKL
jgi:hypothetical protein